MTVELDLVPCPVVIADVLETWLGHLEVHWKLLSLHQECEVVSSVVRMVHFSVFDGVVSKEIVDDEREVVEFGVESEDSAVVIEELLLVLDSSTAE